MQTAMIAGLNKPVSRIIFGTAVRPMLRGEDADALLDAAVSAGINTFDCARGYGGAEASLGRWIARRGNRDNVVLLTKCGNVGDDGRVRVDRQVIETELEQSLRMLQTDHIDIFLLHRDDPKTPLAETLETLNAAKRAGKIGIFGVSNWTHTRIEAANRYAAAHGLEGFSVSSPYYGPARQMADPWGGSCVALTGPENEAARAWYAKSGLPVFAYSVLGHGFFGGGFKSGDTAAAETLLDGAAKRAYLCDENMRRLQRAETLAARDGCSVAQIALRYVLGSPMNVFAVMSTKDPARLKENARLAGCPLSAQDCRFLEHGAQA